jgi:hypothetical protein
MVTATLGDLIKEYGTEFVDRETPWVDVDAFLSTPPGELDCSGGLSWARLPDETTREMRGRGSAAGGGKSETYMKHTDPEGYAMAFDVPGGVGGIVEVITAILDVVPVEHEDLREDLRELVERDTRTSWREAAAVIGKGTAEKGVRSELWFEQVKDIFAGNAPPMKARTLSGVLLAIRDVVPVEEETIRVVLKDKADDHGYLAPKSPGSSRAWTEAARILTDLASNFDPGEPWVEQARRIFAGEGE